MTSGNETTVGTTNSLSEDVMLLIVSAQRLLLFRITGSSRNEPTQTLPKLPPPGTTRLRRGRSAVPDTLIECGPCGSSLTMVIVADLAPALVGAKRRATSTASPSSSMIGYETTLGTWNSGDDEVMLVIESGPSPPLSIVSSSSTNEPTQTWPKFPWSAMAVTTRPSARSTLKKNGSIEVATGVTLSGASSVFVPKFAFR